MSQIALRTPPVSATGTLWVGFSGGCDSTALLHLLHASGASRLRAVHVHHGLQASADDWLRHCRAQCRALGVAFKALKIIVQPDGKGMEAAAREARYSAIAGLLRPGDVFATAHHQDDQAETVLFRALRGTGVPGLSAMRECEPLGDGVLWRPLLDVSRARLREYAGAAALSWIEDPQNTQPQYARAYLRTAILPALQRHFPAAPARLAQLAAHARDATELLTEMAHDDLARLADPAGALPVSELLAMSPARRRNLLYHAWNARGFLPPESRWFERLEREVLRARPDAAPVLASGAGEARRFRDRVYLMPRLPPPPGDVVLPWTGRRRLRLPDGCGELVSLARLPAGLTVRFASGGERFKPWGEARRRTLKNLCQEAGIPPWLRERMPLVEVGGELLAIADRWQTAAAVESGLRFEWFHDLIGAPELSRGGRIT